MVVSGEWEWEASSSFWEWGRHSLPFPLLSLLLPSLLLHDMTSDISFFSDI